jgi:hypothetical protein
MVHQNALVISDSLRKHLENGGGTKETTRAIRANLGQNFVDYCERREDAWCTDPTTAPAWWSSEEHGAPRNMEELCSGNEDKMIGNFFKNWLWEMQVGPPVICHYGYKFPTFQVSKKDEDGQEIVDFPFFHTAAAARSHVKCFLLKELKMDIGDRRRFPEWGAWWKAYQGEVLKPNGKMQV